MLGRCGYMETWGSVSRQRKQPVQRPQGGTRLVRLGTKKRPVWQEASKMGTVDGGKVVGSRGEGCGLS